MRTRVDRMVRPMRRTSYPSLASRRGAPALGVVVLVSGLMLTLTACGGSESLGILSLKRVDAAQAQRIQLDQLTQANRRLESDIEQVRKAPGGSVDCPPGSVRLTPDGRLLLPRGGPLMGAERPGETTRPDGDQNPVGGPAGRPGFKVDGLPGPGSGAEDRAGLPDKSNLKGDGKPPAKGDGRPDVKPADADALVAMSGPELARKLEQATALVLTDKGTGTGFFISDKLLITNRHVVESAAGGNLFVTSRALGMKRRATVLRVTAGSTPGGADFALLRLDDGTGPAALGVGTKIEKLATVVAAGYPGLAIRADPEFARLLAGDGTAAPDLNFTQGAVQSLTQRPGSLSLIVHSASTLKGNSGGPLVDMCGRVVGVNTFIALDEKQAGRLSYALGADGLLAFLREAAGSAQGDSRLCPG